MKKTIQFILAGALVLGAASCAKESNNTQDKNVQPSAPVTLVADIVNETETKATLAESDGTFAFSADDAIKVYNGTTLKSGTTTAGGTTATFVMEEGFENTGSGFAGFPAAIVNNITASGVTFILPTSYTYAQVGGSDPDAAKVPCPMMATFTAGNKLQFKQVGSVVRIRVTNIAAGTLSFTFPTDVTGRATVEATPSGTNDGITTLTNAGKTITVSGVPAITTGNYAYITLPLPTATAPENILVVNNPADATASRMAAIAGSATALERAGGYKLSVSPAEVVTPSFKVAASKSVVIAPGNLMAHVASYSGGATAEADQWKFGGYFEYIGGATDGGNYLFANSTSFSDKWIDLLSWQGSSATNKVHGLVNLNAHNAAYHGNNNSESTYNGCWNGLTISNGGTYTWRPMTKDEWTYLLNTRTTSTLNGTSNARFARATVAGVNGLLIFPDNVGSTWDDGTMGSKPSGINSTGSQAWGTNTYTSAQFVAMYNAGIVFLPAAGYRIGTSIDHVGTDGIYWSSTASNDATKAYYLNVSNGRVEPSYSSSRHVGRAVRLVREVTE